MNFADIKKPVEIDIPVVETGLRKGEKGAVVVLVNYPRKKWENLKIKVNGVDVKRIKKIISTSLGKELTYRILNEKEIEIKLPFLGIVDMIGIFY